MKKRVLAVLLAIIMLVGMLPGTMEAAPSHFHHGIDFEPWTSDNSLPNQAGSYYLTKDVTLTGYVSLKGDVNLCLNGHVVKQTGNLSQIYVVNKNYTLSIFDCKPEETHTGNFSSLPAGGVLTGATRSAVRMYQYQGSPTFNLYGGTIIGNTNDTTKGGGVSIGSGTFNMYGGTICGNSHVSGAGVALCDSACTFNMYGGTIKGNTASQNGGGLYITSNSTFNMYGGEIIDNSAINGGGVCLNNGAIILGGTAKITGNKSGSGESAANNNVYLPADKTVTLATGGNAPKAGMSIGVTMATGTGVFTGTATEAQKDYFTSDNADYAVKYNSGCLELVAGYAITNGAKQGDAATNHGYLTIDKTKAEEGETVTVTVTPSEGYALVADSLKVYKTGDESTTVNLTAKQDGTYTFEMPAYAVTVTATFEEDINHTHDDITFEPWTSTNSLPTTAGSWYLDTDVTLTETWTVPAGTAETSAVTNLCLNGHTIRADCASSSFSVITIPQYAALNIYDCNGTNTTHYYTYNGNDVAWTLLDSAPATSVPLADFDSTEDEVGTAVALSGGCITGGTGYKTSATSANSDGGGIYVKGGSLTMYGGNICDNTATNMGGGVYVQYGTFTLEDGVIFNNELNSAEAHSGGAVALYQSNGNQTRSFTMNGGIICGNRSFRTAAAGLALGCGGVYVRGNTSSFEMTGGVMMNNYAAMSGGAILIQQSAAFKMSNSKICNNTALYGAGMYLGNSSSSDLIENCEITGNTATKYGGGIYSSALLTVKGTIISGNTAGEYGAGLYASGETTVEASTVSKNSANDSGGGIYIVNSLTLKETDVSENYAKSAGGGIQFPYTLDSKHFVMDSGTIRNNESGSSGGGIQNNSIQMEISGTAQITGNTAKAYGGGVYNGSGGKLTIGGTAQITGNTAGSTGGGVYNAGTMTIGGSAQITGNEKGTTTTTASNVYLYGKTITIGTGDNAPVTTGDKKMSVGVTMAASTGVFTGANDADYSALFSADAGADYKINNNADDSNKLKLVAKYSVTVTSGIKNGTVTTDVTGGKAFEGDIITLTITPNTDYRLKAGSLQINNGAVALTKVNDTTYTFAMPKAAVTVKAVFEEDTHDHTFTYAASGNTITATCDNAEGKCSLTNRKVTLTLTAGDAAYSNSAYTGAVLNKTAWNAAGLTAPTIHYVGRGNTVYADNTTAPTNAGTYTATITVDGKTASVDFEITKATPYIKTAPAPSDITYGQTLTVSTLVGGYAQASGTDTTQVGGLFEWKDGTIAPAVSDSEVTEYEVTFTPSDDFANNFTTATCKVKLTVEPASETAPAAGEGYTLDYAAETLIADDDYEVSSTSGDTATALAADKVEPGTTEKTYYVRRKSGDSNHSASEWTPITVPARPVAPANAPELVSKTDTDVILATNSGYEYSKDGMNWQDSNEFTSLNANTSYSFYQRAKATDSAFASEASSALNVTTKAAPAAAPSVSAESVTESTVTLPVSGEPNTYEYSTDGTNWNSTFEFTGLSPATEYTYYVRVKETDTAMPSQPATVTVNTAYATPATVDETGTVSYADESFTPNSGYEISKTDGAGFAPMELADGKVTLDPNTTYYIRKAASGSVPASEPVSLTTPARPAAPVESDFTITEETVENKKDGSFGGITDTMEYSTDDGATWISGFAALENLSSETVKVRTKATDAAFSSEEFTHTFTPSTEKLNVIINETETQVAYGDKLTKPATDPEKSGYTFGGWYRDEECKQAWNFATDAVEDDLTLYPKWIKDSEKTAVIGGNVTENSIGVPDATVALYLGADRVAATVTDENGDFSFDAVENGTYNLVITSSDGSKTMTELVTVDTTGSFHVDVELPDTEISSIVEVADGTVGATRSDVRKTVVGGLDEAAKNTAANVGDIVEIKLTVESKDDTMEHADDIKALAGSGKILEFLDLTLTKTVNAVEEPDFGSTNTQLLNIVIPFDFSSVVSGSVKVLRYHGAAEELTLNPAAGNEGFMIDTLAGAITILAQKFSSYAIVYQEETYYPESHFIVGIDTENGKLTVNRKNATVGQLVTITVAPDEGYQLDELTVNDVGGNALTLTKVNDTTYTFRMPDGEATISAAFGKVLCPQDETCIIAIFNDTDPKAWYHDGVHYCVEEALMEGIGDGLFDPEGANTRSMIVTILWRMEGSPVVNYAMSFTDVPEDEWYAEAVRWAQSVGIVEGYCDEAFGPTDFITREQMATILYRYAKYQGIDVANENTLADYTDADKVSFWALDAMKWANAVGLVQGRTETTLVPEVSITRAEAATMVQRYCEAF